MGREMAASLQNLAPRSPALWSPGRRERAGATCSSSWQSASIPRGGPGAVRGGRGTSVTAPDSRRQQATASGVWFCMSGTVSRISGTYHILLGVCPQVGM